MDEFYIRKARLEFGKEFEQKIDDIGYTLSSSRGFVEPSDGLEDSLVGMVCIVAHIQASEQISQEVLSNIRTEALPSMYVYKPKSFHLQPLELPVVVRYESSG